LTVAQRDTLIEALKKLGPASHPSPACLCHWRVRLDGKAAIFEADFGENEVTIDALKSRLAAIFGVDPATITHVVTQTAYGPLVTFSRSGDKLRLVQFGGVNHTWMESGDACRAYLKANMAEWEQAQ
jgi:hypothetical protein